MDDKRDIFSKLSIREKIALCVGAFLLIALITVSCAQTVITYKTYNLLKNSSVPSSSTEMQNDIIWENGESVSSDIESTVTGDTSTNASEKNTQSSSAPSTTKSNAKTTVTTTQQTTKRPEQMSYVLNIDSKKIHSPECASAKKMKEANRKDVTLNDAQFQEYLNDGYTVCGICKAGI